MLTWTPYPFVRITLCYCFGILLFNTSFITIPFANYIFFIAIPIYLILIIIWKKWQFIQYNFFFGFGIFLLLSLAGYLTAQKNDLSSEANALETIANKAEFLAMKVNSVEDQHNRYSKYQAILKYVFYDGTWHQVNIGCLLNVKNEKVSFKNGQFLLTQSRLSSVQQSDYPELFDYKKYLERKNIFFNVYVDASNVRILNNGENSVMKYLWDLRDFLKKVLNKFVPNNEAKAMLKGLLLGDKTDIAPELIQQYNAVGAAHVLAISGLHVGILFLLFSRLFGFLKKRKWSRYFYYALLMLVIWTYAGITGFSASVSRASIMFSCILIAEWINRKNNIYNTLAIAAFILLLINPNNLYDVGFQLSFTAVAGIVYLYPKFYHLIYFPGLIPDYCWKLTCVSLSAQVATLPLVIYYFHQIPLLGVLSNFIVINGVWIILVLGFSLFFLSFWATLATLLGELLSVIIVGMNASIGFIDRIPIGPITHVYWKLPWVFLIITAVLMLIMFFEFRKIWLLRLAAISIVMCSILMGIYYWNHNHQQLLIFYRLNDDIAIEKVIGQNVVAACNIPATDSKIYGYTIDPMHLIYHIDHIDKMRHKQEGNNNQFLIFKGQSVLVLNEPLYLKNLENNFEIDYLVIPRNASLIAKHLPQNLIYRHLVINSSKDVEIHSKDYRFYNLKQSGNLLVQE